MGLAVDHAKFTVQYPFNIRSDSRLSFRTRPCRAFGTLERNFTGEGGYAGTAKPT